MFKTTEYFKHTRIRPDRSEIRDEWVEYVMSNPIHIEIQKDGRYKKWVRIEEVGKYLRVILLEDNES